LGKNVEMIDRLTGAIILDDGRRLGPPIDRQEFEASSLGQMSAVSVRNEPWCSYRLPALRIDGEVFGAIIYFYGPKIDSLCLAQADLSAKTWADWSEEEEEKTHKIHQAWLTKLFGTQRKFQWGEIWVGRDAKTTDAKIIIRWYRKRKSSFGLLLIKLSGRIIEQARKLMIRLSADHLVNALLLPV
jgi:hypothetical protein